MKKIVFKLTLMSYLCACQTMYIPQARDIKRKPKSGGVIGIPLAQRAEDRSRAEELMKHNCQPLLPIVIDEGETVVGQETRSSISETNRDDSRRNHGEFLGMALISGSNSGKESSQSSITTQLKEWQIVYNCESEKTVPTSKKK
jgi:hypothetical protein